MNGFCHKNNNVAYLYARCRMLPWLHIRQLPILHRGVSIINLLVDVTYFHNFVQESIMFVPTYSIYFTLANHPNSVPNVHEFCDVQLLQCDTQRSKDGAQIDAIVTLDDGRRIMHRTINLFVDQGSKQQQQFNVAFLCDIIIVLQQVPLASVAHGRASSLQLKLAHSDCSVVQQLLAQQVYRERVPRQRGVLSHRPEAIGSLI